MSPAVLVLDHNGVSREALCCWLREEGYAAVTTTDVEHLTAELERVEHAVVLLDLDSVPVEPASLLRLGRRYPRARIIVLSSRLFHPELAAAMRDHIYACVRKPLDLEELLYWLRSLGKGGFSSRDSPSPGESDR